MYDTSIYTLCHIMTFALQQCMRDVLNFLQVTVSYYAGLNAVLGLDQEIEFETNADAITLDIPESGSIIAETSWKIVPLMRLWVISAMIMVNQ